MVVAWMYNEKDDSDPRMPHKYEPNQEVSLDKLASIGVLHWTYDPETEMDKIDEIANERKYCSRDKVIISKDKLPNYEEKLKSFFTEHIHDDEEIRYIVDGSGYFDIRDDEDKWIRAHLSKGDMIVLPAGIYHRFILDDTNYLTAMRLFKEDPKWTPINRSEPTTDQHPTRLEYLKEFALKKNKSPPTKVDGDILVKKIKGDVSDDPKEQTAEAAEAK